MKNEKMRNRVRVNTWLLALLTIVIPMLTLLAAQRLYVISKNFIGISDAPGLCYDEKRFDNKSKVIENAYPCDTNEEPVTTDNENVIFLYNQINFVATTNFREMLVIIFAIGTILTATSFITTIIYWNHNRQ